MPAKDTKDKVITISDTPSTAGQVGGKLEMADDVVATIANLAAKRIKGIYSMGKSGLLNLPIGSSNTRGVDAEVGEKQAALDLEIVIEYGCDIQAVVGELRQLIAKEVFKMAGREVVEVNVKVSGIRLPEGEKPVEEPPPSRVK